LVCLSSNNHLCHMWILCKAKWKEGHEDLVYNWQKECFYNMGLVYMCRSISVATGVTSLFGVWNCITARWSAFFNLSSLDIVWQLHPVGIPVSMVIWNVFTPQHHHDDGEFWHQWFHYCLKHQGGIIWCAF
jgi:hypothetical protein